MALKECGLDVDDWDQWSQGNDDPDHGYAEGVCDQKWGSSMR